MSATKPHSLDSGETSNDEYASADEELDAGSEASTPVKGSRSSPVSDGAGSKGSPLSSTSRASDSQAEPESLFSKLGQVIALQ